jgi:hypothetical protein
MNQIFANGVKLAKLVNPELAGGTKVQIAVGSGGQASISAGSPKQLIASVVREFERQGISRDKITPLMIEQALGGKLGSPQPEVIEHRAIESKPIEEVF